MEQIIDKANYIRKNLAIYNRRNSEVKVAWTRSSHAAK
jgi:hypothetical protein